MMTHPGKLPIQHPGRRLHTPKVKHTQPYKYRPGSSISANLSATSPWGRQYRRLRHLKRHTEVGREYRYLVQWRITSLIYLQSKRRPERQGAREQTTVLKHRQTSRTLGKSQTGANTTTSSRREHYAYQRLPPASRRNHRGSSRETKELCVRINKEARLQPQPPVKRGNLGVPSRNDGRRKRA